MIKKTLKEAIRYVLYFAKRKRYSIWIDKSIAMIEPVRKDCSKEYFFGYYDRSPERKGRILFHEMNLDKQLVNVVVRDISKGAETLIATVPSFNWQMGCRTLWIDDDIISFNDFDGTKYVCKWFSTSRNEVVKTFDKPLQDYSAQGKFFIGVNYQRLRSFAKEYGYYCLPEMNTSEFDNYKEDGLWKVDIESGQSELLISLADIIAFESKNVKSGGKHFVNHVMINPNGKSFIFIHRYYVGNERNDRLFLYENGKLKSLFAGRIHSHYCWINEKFIFGYGDYQGHRGFHGIDIDSGRVTHYPELDAAHPRDGHPTCFGDWVGIDDYPDLSRMQPLILYNLKTKHIYKLGEFFHDLKHVDRTRCDLHPRFASDGSGIYIDTIYSGSRQLCKININWKSLS